MLLLLLLAPLLAAAAALPARLLQRERGKVDGLGVEGLAGLQQRTDARGTRLLLLLLLLAIAREVHDVLLPGDQHQIEAEALAGLLHEGLLLLLGRVVQAVKLLLVVDAAAVEVRVEVRLGDGDGRSLFGLG